MVASTLHPCSAFHTGSEIKVNLDLLDMQLEQVDFPETVDSQGMRPISMTGRSSWAQGSGDMVFSLGAA